MTSARATTHVRFLPSVATGGKINAAQGGRRRSLARASGKKSKRSTSPNDDYASDFALYGSFDEDYGEGAGALLGKGEFASRKGQKKKAGYDAVANVLDALAAERASRGGKGDFATNNSQGAFDGVGRGRGFGVTRTREEIAREEGEGEAFGKASAEVGGTTAGRGRVAAEGAGKKATAVGSGEGAVKKVVPVVAAAAVPAVPAAATPAPAAAPAAAAPKPKPAAKPKQVEDVDPASTSAKAMKTLQKWGFADADIDAALNAVNAAVGNTATAKKRQVAALDWLLAKCALDRVPEEYKVEAQKARAK